MRRLLLTLAAIATLFVPGRAQADMMLGLGATSAAAGVHTGACDTITGGCASAHSMSQKLVASYAGPAFELINPAPAWTGTASISGTTLTVANTATGAMANGLALSGAGSGATPAVKPVTYTSGCSSSTCNVNISQTAASVTAAYSVLNVGFQSNGAWDESTWRSFCAGVMCLVEKVFNQGSGGSADDLIASQTSDGVSGGKLNCSASIIVCAPMFIIDAVTDTPVAFTVSSEMGAWADAWSGNSTSGLPAGATNVSVMFSGFNLYGSGCCGGLYGLMETNPSSIVAGNMYAIGFANGTGSGSSVNCLASNELCTFTDLESNLDPSPIAVYDTNQFHRLVIEGQYIAGTNTDKLFYNNTQIGSQSPPTEPASQRQNWLRIGAGGDRSWLLAAFSDGWVSSNVGDHTAARNVISNFYAGRSASATAGPLDVGWYMPIHGFNAAGGGLAAEPVTIGIGMGGWSARPLSVWYTGPIITVQNSTGSGSIQTFSSVAGVVDPSLAMFCASTCLVNALFTQAWTVGNVFGSTPSATYGNTRQTNNDLSATGTQRPTLTLNSLNGEPTIHFSGAQQLCTTRTPIGGYHGVYPTTMSAVARRTGSFSSLSQVLVTDVNTSLGFAASANSANFQIGGTVNKTASDSHWHGLQVNFNGSSSGTVYVDGVSSATASFTTSNFNPTYYCLGGHSGSGNLTGDIAEVVWTFDQIFSGATNYAPGIYSNDTAYWGSLPN